MSFASVGTASATSTNNKTASTANVAQTVAATTAQINANELVVAVLSSDSLVAAASGAPTNNHNVLTVGGIPFSKQQEYTFGSAAGSGATCSIWTLVPNANIASGSNIQATFSGAVTAKAVTIWRFSRDTTKVVDIADTEVRGENADPGAMTLDTGVTSREHLFIRGMAGETNSTAMTPGGSMTAMTASTTSGGGAATNMAARGQFQIVTAQSLATDPTVASANWASVGIALYERALPGIGADPAPDPAPTNAILIDNFNRTDGQMAAGGVWAGTEIRSANASDIGVVGNQLARYTNAVASDELCGSLIIGPDVDFQIDSVILPSGGNDFIFFMAIQNPKSSSASGVFCAIDDTAAPRIGEFDDPTLLISRVVGSSGSVTTGDTLWFSTRGAVISIYKKTSGGSLWSLLLTHTLASGKLPRLGTFGVTVGGPNQRWDNLYGGTVGTTAPASIAAIDDFNRANATSMPAGALWTGTAHNSASASGVGINSNLLYYNGAGAPSSLLGASGVQIGPDFDFVADCVTSPPAGNSDFRIYTLLGNSPGTSTVNGYAFGCGPGSGSTNGWYIGMLSGSSISSMSTNTSEPAVAAGDRVWISKRGSLLSTYVNRAGTTTWKTVVQKSDSTYNRVGQIAVYIGETTQRWDNLRGGTATFTPSSTISTAGKPLLDSFNRANATPPGGDWATSGVGGSANVVDLVSNRLKASAAADTGRLNTNYGPDAEIGATLTTLPTSYASLYLRGQGLDTASWAAYYLIWSRGSPNDSYSISKRVGGTITNNLGGGPFTSPTLAAGDKISLTARGNTLQAWKFSGGSWVAVGSAVTDTDIKDRGQLGVEIGDTTGVIDDLFGGTLPRSLVLI